jgi:hypothetical protein
LPSELSTKKWRTITFPFSVCEPRSASIPTRLRTG